MDEREIVTKRNKLIVNITEKAINELENGIITNDKELIKELTDQLQDIQTWALKVIKMSDKEYQDCETEMPYCYEIGEIMGYLWIISDLEDRLTER